MKKYFTVLFLGIQLISAQAQSVPDSLELELNRTFGTKRVSLLFRICDKYINNTPEKVIAYGEEARKLSVQLGDSMLVIESINYISTAKLNSGDLYGSLQGFQQALASMEQQNNKLWLADLHNSIGIVQDQLGNFDAALKSYFRSLELYEALQKDVRDEKMELRAANVRNNIGLIYYSLDRYEEAKSFFEEAHAKYVQYESNYGVKLVINNLGLVYEKLGEDDKALEYFKQSLELEKLDNNLNGMASSYNNIGTIYTKKINYPEALVYYRKAMETYKKVGNMSGLAIACNNVGRAYFHLNNLTTSLHFQLRGLRIAESVKAKYTALESYKSIAETYEKVGNYSQAFKYMREYASVKDHIFNDKNIASIAEMQTKYESEKKAKEIELLNKNRELQQLELKRQISLRNSFISGSVLILIISFTVFNKYRTEQKAKTVLEQQNEEMLHQKEEIQSQRDQIQIKSLHLQEALNLVKEKSQSITDSINYARRIQDAMLPSVAKIKACLPNSFIYYEPKDTVSGDFYWFSELPEAIVLAVVDCTGHGVPGAIMSMMGHTLLNQIVNEKGVTNPAKILSMMNKEIYNSMRSRDNGYKGRDGMEAAICTYWPRERRLEFSGARHPLFIIEKGMELQSLNGDRATLGVDLNTPFSNYQIEIHAETMVYMSTDGYHDQFGGEKGKKFHLGRFKQLLSEIHELPVDTQQRILKENFMLWRGKEGQVDDVLVAGIKFFA